MRFVPRPLLVMMMTIVALIDLTFGIAAVLNGGWFSVLAAVWAAVYLALDIRVVYYLFIMSDADYSAKET